MRKERDPTTNQDNLGQSKKEETGLKVPARVYSFEQHQVPDSFEDVEDTIPIFHCLTKIWIDPDDKKISKTKFL